MTSQPPQDEVEEVARHRLHLAWRLKNGEEFKNLPLISADEIKQAAAELESAAIATLDRLRRATPAEGKAVHP